MGTYGIRANWKQEDWLSGHFPKRLAHSYFEPQELLHLWKVLFTRLRQSQLEQVAENILSWKFPVLSRGGWSESQVTAGGISANETDDTLQSK